MGAAAGWTVPGRPYGRKRRWANLIRRAAGRATGSCVHARARHGPQGVHCLAWSAYGVGEGRTRPTAAAAARAARARCRARSGPGWHWRPAAPASTGTRRSAAAAPAPRSSAPLRSRARGLSGRARGRLPDQTSSFAGGAAPAAWKPASSARHTSAPRRHDVPATILLFLARLASSSLRARCGSAAGAADTETAPWPSWPGRALNPQGTPNPTGLRGGRVAGPHTAAGPACPTRPM